MMDFRDEQCLKANFPISVTESGMMMDVKDEQP
jgi:hypothetical protein